MCIHAPVLSLLGAFTNPLAQTLVSGWLRVEGCAAAGQLRYRDVLMTLPGCALALALAPAPALVLVPNSSILLLVLVASSGPCHLQLHHLCLRAPSPPSPFCPVACPHRQHALRPTYSLFVDINSHSKLSPRLQPSALPTPC